MRQTGAPVKSGTLLEFCPRYAIMVNGQRHFAPHREIPQDGVHDAKFATRLLASIRRGSASLPAQLIAEVGLARRHRPYHLQVLRHAAVK